uniref:Cytochrome c biogenesis FN n=1 Tax=Balanophora laxiflora TaxID=1128103 RepID=A0A3Q9JN71_9MAGN|nr:cytochrome c biogenesis FN [Balanophora laxiflora]UPI49001.1 cytochrome c biogenesis FN [Balanophora laxiflora]
MNELFHYYLFLVIFLAFTYNNKQPPAFGAALAFFCFLLSFLGILFCHIPYNLSTILLTANNNLSIPLFYQISGTWSNHEGSILSWCRIPSFYGFLICYRCPPKIHHHNVSELRILNFYLFLYYRHSSRTKIKKQLFYTPFLPSFNIISIYVNNIRYQKVFYHLKNTILNHKYIIYQFLSEIKYFESLRTLPNKLVSLLRSFKNHQISESILFNSKRSIYLHLLIIKKVSTNLNKLIKNKFLHLFIIIIKEVSTNLNINKEVSSNLHSEISIFEFLNIININKEVSSNLIINLKNKYLRIASNLNIIMNKFLHLFIIIIKEVSTNLIIIIISIDIQIALNLNIIMNKLIKNKFLHLFIIIIKEVSSNLHSERSNKFLNIININNKYLRIASNLHLFIFIIEVSTILNLKKKYRLIDRSFNKLVSIYIYNPLILIFNKYLKNKKVFSIVLPIIIIVVATNSYEYVLVINSESELRSRGFYRPAFLMPRLFTQKKNKTREGYLYFLRRGILYSNEGFKRLYFLKEGTQTTHTTYLLLLLLMARDGKEIASSIEEQRFGLGIALFFSFFLSASPDPFIRNFFVRTEPLSELNPVPQDPLSAIHPPFIYAGEVASAMGFVLCRSKMMTGIVILHSPPIRNNTLTKKGTLLCSAGCVDESSIIRRSELLFTLEFSSSSRHVVGSMLSRIYKNNRLCNSLMPRLVLLLDDGREQGKLFGLNTVVSVQDREFVKIWILICRWFLTVGILPGSWWAYHELGRGGWWFRDPVENASFMPRLLATALLHSVIIPLLNSWTSRMNLVTFLCCILGTFLIRSGLLASVHSFATDTLGIFLWWFFLIMTGISIILFSQMKQQASVHITYKKEMILA